MSRDRKTVLHPRWRAQLRAHGWPSSAIRALAWTLPPGERRDPIADGWRYEHGGGRSGVWLFWGGRLRW